MSQEKAADSNVSNSFGLLQHDLISPAEASRILGVAVGTLGVWRSTGRHNLPFVKVGAKVRYRQSDIEKWVAARVRLSSSDGSK